MSSDPTLTAPEPGPLDPRAGDASPTLEEHEPAPVGTLFLMILFLAAIAGLWGTVYWMLLSR